MQKPIIFESQSVSAIVPIQPNKSADFVRFDTDNMFPVRLLDAVRNSPTQSAILNSLTTYILGAGCDWEGYMSNPNPDDTWDSLLYKVVSDYVIFESFAFQLCLNNDGRTITIYHQPIEEVRVGKVDEYGRFDEYIVCADWRKYNKRNSISIKKFNGLENLNKGEVQLIVFKKMECGERFYHIPNYYSAINYILADARLGEYYNNITANNFQPSAVFSFPYNPDDEQKQQIHDGIKESFTGAKNAGAILCLFGESDKEVKVNSFQPSSPDIYNNVSETILSNLVTANRLTSPTLAGILPKAGFSSQSDVIVTAYNLYKLTVVDGHKRFILQSINSLLKSCGMNDSLSFLEYDIQAELGGNTVKNDVIEDKSTEDENNNNAVVND